jgi:hypothetical protein
MSVPVAVVVSIASLLSLFLSLSPPSQAALVLGGEMVQMTRE